MSWDQALHTNSKGYWNRYYVSIRRKMSGFRQLRNITSGVTIWTPLSEVQSRAVKNSFTEKGCTRYVYTFREGVSGVIEYCKSVVLSDGKFWAKDNVIEQVVNYRKNIAEVSFIYMYISTNLCVVCIHAIHAVYIK